ncbi:lipid asymmetry maintenance protein MlaB [Pseudomonadota bacterium]
MSSARLEASGQGKASLSGELTFESVPSLVAAIEPLLDSATVLELNLSGVSRSDSAGVALLVSWERKVRSKAASISYTGVPEQLLGLARVSGVEQILFPDTH